MEKLQKEKQYLDMKSKYLIGIFMACSTFLLAQSPNMEIGIEIQPILSSITVNPTRIYKSSIFFTKANNDKWIYSVGIGFANLGKQNTIILDTINVQITNSETDLKAYRKGSFQYQYLYFPINLLYNIHNLKLLGGIHPYLFFENETPVSNQYEFHIKKQNPISQEQLHKLNFALNLGVEYDISLKKNWFILLKSTGSYFLIPQYKVKNSSKIKQFSLGLTIGIKRRLSLGNKKIVNNAE